MSGMLIGGRSLLVSMAVIGMGGIRRKVGEGMGSVYGSIYNLVGLGFRGMFVILLDPAIQSGFGRIGGVKRGCYEMFSLPYIRLLSINRLWCPSICLGILKIWFGR
jgi:hypothetical protein